VGVTISENYRDQNRQLHETNASYGNGIASEYWFPLIEGIAKDLDAAAVLDYGAGKQAMARKLPGLLIVSYDPAVPGIDATPSPADFVVCNDVLEHIEPEMLDAVLDDLQRLAIKGVFLSVCVAPAGKLLPDGRNAHLIQEPADWWLPKLMSRWKLQMFHLHKKGGTFGVFMLPKKNKVRG